MLFLIKMKVDERRLRSLWFLLEIRQAVANRQADNLF